MFSALLALSPDARLTWHGGAEEPGATDLSAAALRELGNAFARSAAAGLLALAALPASEPLPASLTFWRGLVQEYLTRLCHIPRLREDGWQGGPDIPDDAALDTISAAAPPLPGMEYLTRTQLAALWVSLNAEMSGRIAGAGDAGAVLAGINTARIEKPAGSGCCGCAPTSSAWVVLPSALARTWTT